MRRRYVRRVHLLWSWGMAAVGAGARASVLVLALLAVAAAPAASRAAGSKPSARAAARAIDARFLSQGARAWVERTQGARRVLQRRLAAPALGSNVDANDPALDLAAGQSETAIAAQRGRGGKDLVLVGWNDASGFVVGDSTDRRASGTGVGLSGNGARSFTDLIGLPNNNVDQQWSGDPAVVSLGDGEHFAVASLFFPSRRACREGGLPAELTIAVSIARVAPDGSGARFSAPIVVAEASDFCEFVANPDTATLVGLDKEWIAYDPQSRTLALSFTRFTLGPAASGLGQIEVVRAHLPGNPMRLRTGAFSEPTVVWNEEPACPDGTPSSELTQCGAVNQGAYVVVAPGGDLYVVWERNIDSLFSGSGDPYAYIHAAYLRLSADRPAIGGRDAPMVVSGGQPNGNPDGGFKSLGNVAIAGYNRGLGNDFPRLALNPRTGEPVIVWNDTSLHPLGDVWLRTARPQLTGLGVTQRVNDDDSYALHFLPAVSVRSNGTICTSWHDRRLTGPDSSRTDYFGECRALAATPAADFRITTGSTDWAQTSSLITPNFGDYTDNTSSGTSTYFTWADGRLGVPQPFVDHRP